MQSLQAPVGLLPLPRPLMTGEVLDAAFRLFRAGLLRCLPYLGVAVLVLELPTLHEGFFAADLLGLQGDVESYAVLGLSVCLDGALLGAISLRLGSISRGEKPSFRSELATVFWRWPFSMIVTLAVLCFPVLLFLLLTQLNPFMPNILIYMIGVLLLWPMAMLAVALPAFWCDGRGPISAIVQAVINSWRGPWRMVGAIIATTSLVTVLYVLAIVIVALAARLLGRTDLFLLSTIRSMLPVIVGAFGLPLILSVLIVANEDLKLRAAARRKATA